MMCVTAKPPAPVRFQFFFYFMVPKSVEHDLRTDVQKFFILTLEVSYLFFFPGKIEPSWNVPQAVSRYTGSKSITKVRKRSLMDFLAIFFYAYFAQNIVYRYDTSSRLSNQLPATKFTFVRLFHCKA